MLKFPSHTLMFNSYHMLVQRVHAIKDRISAPRLSLYHIIWSKLAAIVFVRVDSKHSLNLLWGYQCLIFPMRLAIFSLSLPLLLKEFENILVIHSYIMDASLMFWHLPENNKRTCIPCVKYRKISARTYFSQHKLTDYDCNHTTSLSVLWYIEILKCIELWHVVWLYSWVFLRHF